MQIKKIHSMRWATDDKSYVSLEADTDAGNNQSIGTPYSEISIIWNDIKQFPIEQIGDVALPPINDVIAQVTEQRLYLLRASDWTQLADVPLSAEKKAEWNTYRQALRDITLQEGYPYNVVFPTEPV